jgi:hypothetical protein
MTKLNHLGVIVSVILVQVLGFFWYGHLFGDTTTTLLDMGTTALVLTLITSFVVFYFLDWLLKLTGTHDINGVVKIGVVFGLLVLGLTVGVHNVGTDGGLHKLLVDAGFQLVAVTLAGVTLLKLKKL